MSAFLNLTSYSILMKTESLSRGQKEISGAIVKRQQSKTEKDDDGGDDDGAAPPKKKKRKVGEPKAPTTPADAAKDTAEKFEYILRKGIEDTKAQNPGKVVVVLVDGGGPHTMEPHVSLRPSRMSSEEIEAELRAAGLWPKSQPSATKARQIYTQSPIPRKQWTNAELIALELGAVVIFIPLNHPHLNVIEQVWRGVKQHYRLHCAQKNLKNMVQCATDALTGAPGAEYVCSVEAILRRIRRTQLISRHLAANPEADPLTENKLRGKKFKPSPEVDVSGVPVFRSLRSESALLDLQLYAHHGNQARIKQYRRGKVRKSAQTCYVFDSFFKYTDLAKEPAFNLESARAEHFARDRATELARSQATYLAWVAAGKPKRVRAKADKTRKKAKLVDREDEEESAMWDSDDEEEDNRLTVAHKNRRQEDEDEASYQGDDANLERRPKSSRGAKPNSVLKAFVLDDSDSSLPTPPASPMPSPPPSPPRPTRSSGRGKKQLATAAARSAAAVVERDPSAAPPAAKGRAPAAAPPPGRAVTRAGQKSLAAAAHLASPAAGAARPAVLPMRKRGVKLVEDPAVAASALVLDVDDMEEALLVPDSDMIGRDLVPHLAHVCNTVVDDYVRLLKRSIGGEWPAGLLVETTAHWVQFGSEKRPGVVAGIFGEKDRLAGVTRVLWPMFSSAISHFALLVIEIQQPPTIRMLDSIPGCRKDWNLSWLQALLRRSFGWKVDATVKFEDCRLQDNKHDCGVYVMANMRSFVESVDFNAPRMPGKHMGGVGKAKAVLALRKHFAAELLSGKLRDWR
jgi:hypothetical protein